MQSDASQVRITPPQNMKTLDQLVDGLAQANNTIERVGVMKAIKELAPANGTVLLAHNRLMTLVLGLAAQGYSIALEFLCELTEDETLCRALFVREDVVEALLTRFGNLSWGFSLHARAGDALTRLVTGNFQNKADFVRLGHAEQIASLFRMYGLGEGVMSCGNVLIACVDDEGTAEQGTKAFDELRHEFLHVPRLMDNLLHGDGFKVSEKVFYSLAKSKSVAEELAGHPRFMEVLVCAIQKDRWPGTALATTTRLVYHAPRRVLVNHPEVITALIALAASSTDHMQDRAGTCLSTWRMALHSYYCGGTSRTSNPTIDQEPNEMAVFWWLNLRKLWTVTATPRLKQHFALRRLPPELFRLLKDTLCGG